MDIQAFRGVREGPIGGRIVVAAIVSVVAVLLIVALARRRGAAAPAREPPDRNDLAVDTGPRPAPLKTP